MNEKSLEKLAEVYNNLLRVHTCGEDSFIMTDCMRTLLEIIKIEVQNNEEKQKLGEE